MLTLEYKEKTKWPFSNDGQNFITKMALDSSRGHLLKKVCLGKYWSSLVEQGVAYPSEAPEFTDGL